MIRLGAHGAAVGATLVVAPRTHQAAVAAAVLGCLDDGLGVGAN